MTFEQYHKMSSMIVATLKNFELQGQEAVQQSEIVNKVIQQLVRDETGASSVQRAAETAKQIANCIHHLITKENLIMITQDSKVKNERLLCLNINLDMADLNNTIGNR